MPGSPAHEWWVAQRRALRGRSFRAPRGRSFRALRGRSFRALRGRSFRALRGRSFRAPRGRSFSCWLPRRTTCPVLCTAALPPDGASCACPACMASHNCRAPLGHDLRGRLRRRLYEPCMPAGDALGAYTDLIQQLCKQVSGMDCMKIDLHGELLICMAAAAGVASFRHAASSQPPSRCGYACRPST
jgi:hypothetical protein